MKIHLHIERLILDGLPISNAERPLLQTAVEVELARLLTENGSAPSLQSDIAVSSVRATDIQMTSGKKPAQVGNEIAQSIYSGIGTIL